MRLQELHTNYITNPYYAVLDAIFKYTGDDSDDKNIIIYHYSYTGTRLTSDSMNFPQKKFINLTFLDLMITKIAAIDVYLRHLCLKLALYGYT